MSWIEVTAAVAIGITVGLTVASLFISFILLHVTQRATKKIRKDGLAQLAEWETLANQQTAKKVTQ